MKKLLLSLSFFCASLLSYAQCDTAAYIAEDFNAFTATNPATDFPQNCWSKLTTGPMVYIDGEENEFYATFYASTSINTAAYLITPQLSTIDGSHKLSFDASKIGDGIVSLQIGTMSDPADEETFTAAGELITLTTDVASYNDIVIAATEGTYIAFKLIADTPHNAATIDNVIWDSVCSPTEFFDENFNMFAGGEFPQNCWSKIATGPMVYVDHNEEGTDQYATFYSLFSANTAGYLITPQIAASNEMRVISFDSFKIGEGNVSIQLGTLSDPHDAETFTALGDVIALTTAPSPYSVEIPQTTPETYLAFQITADAEHHAAVIDNIALVSLLNNEDFNINKPSLTLYPNPSADKNVTVALNNISAEGKISIYSLTGAKVFETGITASQTQQLNLSVLNSGMYLVTFEGENYNETQKLIIK